MNSSTAQNRFSKIGYFVFFGLLLVIVVNILNRIFSSPFDFDEGVGLIMSKILFLTGRYASYETMFDPVITVGPTVYFPTALTFLFGNVFLPRIIILIYSLLLIFVVVSGYLKDRTAKTLFLSLLCLTPYFFYFSAHVLGEIPAIFFCLAGLYFLNAKKYFLAGTFLMLSIITKNIFSLSIAPALFLLFTQRKSLTIKSLLFLATPFCLITAGWELYKLQAFHFSFVSYFDNLYQLLRYGKGLSRIHLEFFPERFSMLSGTFGFNGVVFLISMVSLSFFSLFKSRSYLLKSLALLTLVYVFYFFLLGSTVWYRHFFPAVIFFIIIFADLLNSPKLSRISLIPIIIALVISILFTVDNSKYLYQQNLLPLFDQTGRGLFTRSDVLKQQLEIANFISSKIPNENLSGVVWYNAPEISYLSGKQILRTPEDPNITYLISHPFGRLLVPAVDARISKYPFKEMLLDTSLYQIYKKNE
jgi:hypothetical protein